MAQKQGQPKTPGKLPPDVAGGVPTHATPDDDGGTVLVVLFLGVGGLTLLWVLAAAPCTICAWRNNPAPRPARRRRLAAARKRGFALA